MADPKKSSKSTAKPEQAKAASKPGEGGKSSSGAPQKPQEKKN